VKRSNEGLGATPRVRDAPPERSSGRRKTTEAQVRPRERRRQPHRIGRGRQIPDGGRECTGPPHAPRRRGRGNGANLRAETARTGGESSTASLGRPTGPGGQAASQRRIQQERTASGSGPGRPCAETSATQKKAAAARLRRRYICTLACRNSAGCSPSQRRESKAGVTVG